MHVIEPRFKLYGFVCDGPYATNSDDLGWSSVHQIFVRRPDGCRYGVVETTGGQFEVWDFCADGWPPDTLAQGPLPKPDVVQSYTTADAAFLATTLGYKSCAT